MGCKVWKSHHLRVACGMGGQSYYRMIRCSDDVVVGVVDDSGLPVIQASRECRGCALTALCLRAQRCFSGSFGSSVDLLSRCKYVRLNFQILSPRPILLTNPSLGTRRMGHRRSSFAQDFDIPTLPKTVQRVSQPQSGGGRIAGHQKVATHP
jgi:hypothetical protein